RLVVDLDQVCVVLDDAARRVQVVSEEVAASAVASGPPQEAAAVLLQDVAQQAQNRQAVDLPRVVMEALSAPGDADAMVVGVAAQEQQRAVADIVGEPEAENPLHELLGRACVLGLEHGVSEPAGLDATTGVA